MKTSQAPETTPHALADDPSLVWAAYARLSRTKPKSKRGRQRAPDESVQRQLALIKAHAAEHGLNLPDHLIFCDPGRSAWQRPGGPPPHRPQWDQMLQAGKAGLFGGLLTWKVDRFTRSPRDGEDLAELALVLRGPACSRMDLRTANGLGEFRNEVVAAARYSHEVSEKVRTAFSDMLAHGYRVGGSGRLFGLEVLSETEIEWDWDADPDARITGPAVVYRQEEVAVVREWARMLLAGETSVAMGAYAAERGFTTTRGGKWTERNLIRTLANPIYGGWLAYRGEVIGRLANVEPILDEETYQAVQAKIGARKQGRKPGGMHLLTGGLYCGNPECERQGTLTGFIRWENRRRRYVCPRRGQVPGCGMTVAAEPVEEIVRDEVIRRANDPELLASIQEADTALDEERDKLLELLDELDRDLAETEAKLARVPRSQARRRAQIERNIDSMTARYEEAEERLRGLGTTPLPTVPQITAEDWDNPQLITPAERAEYMRRLGVRFTVLPSERPQGASRRPFESWRVVISSAQ
jgi:site-specific DNA recombinase